MTDREIAAQGGHTTGKVLPKYVKRTLRQVASGAKKPTRIANKSWTFVRMSNSTFVRMAGPI